MCTGTLCNLNTIEVSESSMVWTVMAVFEQDFRYCLQPSVPYSEIDTDVQMINQFAEPNESTMGNFEIADFSVDSLSGYQPPDYQAALADNLPGTSRAGCLNELPILVRTNTSPVDVFRESKKRKVRELSTSSSETFLSTASRDQLKDNSSYSKKNSPEQGKKKSSEKVQNKLDEVIHVRAKRGQATDSHSLAERVRRQKINNKLRCLQDLVPGCHKTMGMAAMLDEIINYVYSLKNQVEFLSTELAAACSLDLFSYTEATEEVKGTNPLEAYKVEIWEREQYGELTRFHSTWPL